MKSTIPKFRHGVIPEYQTFFIQVPLSKDETWTLLQFIVSYIYDRAAHEKVEMVNPTWTVETFGEQKYLLLLYKIRVY